MAVATLPYQEKIEYPESDGKPVAESEIHLLQLLALVYVLRNFYRAAPDVYVGGNMLMYYVEGEPSEVVAPDVFVVKGVGKHLRRTFKLWEEGKAPDFIIELTSKSTRYQDLANKRGLYETLGVQEYFLFDPQREYLTPPLRGYRLVHGVYELVSGETLTSEVLGLELRVEGGELHLYHPLRQEYLLTPPETTEQLEETKGRLEETAERLEETAERLEETAERLEETKQRAARAEAENKELRAELERLRREQNR